eukprot:g10081.t1
MSTGSNPSLFLWAGPEGAVPASAHPYRRQHDDQGDLNHRQLQQNPRTGVNTVPTSAAVDGHFQAMMVAERWRWQQQQQQRQLIHNLQAGAHAFLHSAAVDGRLQAMGQREQQPMQPQEQLMQPQQQYVRYTGAHTVLPSTVVDTRFQDLRWSRPSVSFEGTVRIARTPQLPTGREVAGESRRLPGFPFPASCRSSTGRLVDIGPVVWDKQREQGPMQAAGASQAPRDDRQNDAPSDQSVSSTKASSVQNRNLLSANKRPFCEQHSESAKKVAVSTTAARISPGAGLTLMSSRSGTSWGGGKTRKQQKPQQTMGLRACNRRLCEVPGCQVQPSYGLVGTTKPRFCSRHKQDGMVGLKNRPCISPGCVTRPHYGPVGGRPFYCATHKTEGCVYLLSIVPSQAEEDTNTNRTRISKRGSSGGELVGASTHRTEKRARDDERKQATVAMAAETAVAPGPCTPEQGRREGTKNIEKGEEKEKEKERSGRRKGVGGGVRVEDLEEKTPTNTDADTDLALGRLVTPAERKSLKG